MPVASAVHAARPNVLFIAIDDLNDMVGFLRNHPGVKMPHMDRLAARGVLFANAHCAAPACAPSRTAVMTGLSPATTGVYLNKHDWRENPVTTDAATIPDRFRKAGCLTKGGGKSIARTPCATRHSPGSLIRGHGTPTFHREIARCPTKRRRRAHGRVNGRKEWYRGRFGREPLAIENDAMADGKVVEFERDELRRWDQVLEDNPKYLDDYAFLFSSP